MAGVDTSAARASAVERATALRRRAAEMLGAIPPALAIVVGLGIVLRAALWLAYDPAIANVADTASYINMVEFDFFVDPVRTAGYAMFLAGVHAVSDDIDTMLALQHLIGIATGVVVYATVRRVGAPVWTGVVGASAVLLALDQVLVEHTILSECLFTFVLVVALYAGVRALEDPRALAGPLTSRHGWLIAAGALLGLSVWVRAASAPLVPFLALFFVLAIPGSVWMRLARGALAGAAAAVVLLVYFSLNSASTGTFGLAEATGWSLYARTAPFADCSQFTPPAGTSKLCEVSSADGRPGPDFYAWHKRSPAQHLFGFPPEHDDELGAFGRQVVLHQPRAYATTVGRDVLRYFFPAINNEQYLGGTDYEYIDIHRRDPKIEPDVQSRLGGYFEPEALSVDEGALDTLTDAQQVLRVHPVLMLQAVILAALGIWLGAGRVRAATALLLGASLLLLVVPSAIGTYNVRYAIPIGGPLIAAGALGLWVCVGRLGGRTPPEAPPATG